MTWLAIIVGIATGIISGCGIGGGSLLVLYLTAVIGVTQYTAAGMNLLYFIGCAPAALIGHLRHKRIHWSTTIWCILAGLLTAVPVSLWVQELDTDWLRRLFGLLLIYVGIKEWRQGKKDR